MASVFSSCTSHGVTKTTIPGNKVGNNYTPNFYLKHPEMYLGMETNLVGRETNF